MTAVISEIKTRVDTSRVMMICDLECIALDESKFMIPSGLTFWIERPNMADPSEHGPLEATIALDADVYAAKSLGEDRDNRILSRLNAPRFNAFLGRLIAATRATSLPVDAADYRDQVGPDGFVIVP